MDPIWEITSMCCFSGRLCHKLYFFSLQGLAEMLADYLINFYYNLLLLMVGNFLIKSINFNLMKLLLTFLIPLVSVFKTNCAGYF